MRREYLVKLRDDHNESQHATAAALGISHQYYSLIENGKRQKQMSVTMLNSLSVHFLTPLHTLLDYEQEYLKEAQN